MSDPPDKPRHHRVADGDRLSQIADAHRIDPQKILDHPDNKALRERRPNPEILRAGDHVVIPEKKPEKHAAKPEAVNCFELKQPPKLRLHFAVAGRPLAKERFRIEPRSKLDTEDFGTTDAHGLAAFHVDCGVREVTLHFVDHDFSCKLLVGHLDPVDSISGVEQRLANLGYACPVAGKEPYGRLTRNAIARFQVDAGIKPTGEIDDATRAKLDAWAHDPSAHKITPYSPPGPPKAKPHGP